MGIDVNPPFDSDGDSTAAIAAHVAGALKTHPQIDTQLAAIGTSKYTAADQLLVSTEAETLATITMAASTIFAKLSSGGSKAATPAEVLTMLKVAAGATVGLSNVSVGGFRRSMTAESGDGTAANLGYRPRAVLLIGGISGTTYASFGFATASGQFVLKMTAGNVSYDGSHSVFITDAGGYQIATVTFSDTGITLSWTLNGTPASNSAYIGFLALK